MRSLLERVHPSFLSAMLKASFSTSALAAATLCLAAGAAGQSQEAAWPAGDLCGGFLLRRCSPLPR